MKKSIVLLALLALGLAACDGNSVAPSTPSVSPSTDTSTSTSTDPTPSEEILTEDITVVANVVGIDTYEGSHSTIWINSPLVGLEGTSWLYTAMTQDATDPNKWSISFEDVEVDQLYSYNFYYGTTEAPDWNNGKNTEGAGQDVNRELLVEEGKTEYSETATFTLPTSFVNLTFTVTPQVITTYGTDPVALYDSTYVWAWNSVTNTTVRFTENEDGTWSYDFTDVPVGSSTFGVTFTLGTASEALWGNYQWGAYTDGQWGDPWGQYTFSVEATTTSLSVNATFCMQPDEVTETGISVNVTLTFTTAPTFSNSFQIVYNDGSEHWQPFVVSETDSTTYTYSIENITSGTSITFYGYHWVSATAIHELRYLNSYAFEVNNITETRNVTITGITYTDTDGFSYTAVTGVDNTQTEAPTTQNITLELTVSGISSYTDATSTIYINSPVLNGTPSASWGTQALTQDSTDSNKWTIDISNVEAGTYSFGIYYGTATETNWNGKCTEGNQDLVVVSGTTTYSITATFSIA